MPQDAVKLAEMKKLEREALECAQSGDTLSALDIYEEMVRKGLAQARHMIALGQCYIENRQRQNAKAIWMRALELEPDNPPCIKALDRYFSGWQKTQKVAPAPRAHTRPRVTPPPPPPAADKEASGNSALTMETITTRPAQPTPPPQAPVAMPPAADQPVQLDQSAQPVQPVPSQALDSTQAGMEAADAARAPAVVDYSDPRSICWDYVLKDAAAEAALRHRPQARQ